MRHELKTWPLYFQQVWDRTKPFEIRKADDRCFEVGDQLVLREWDPTTEEYTGRRVDAVVTCVIGGQELDRFGFAAPHNVVVMGLEVIGCSLSKVGPERLLEVLRRLFVSSSFGVQGNDLVMRAVVDHELFDTMKTLAAADSERYDGGEDQ